MERTKQSESLSSQMKRRAVIPTEKGQEYDGNFGTVISTGSTLLDLNISGGRVRGGGLPGGILVEIFGASGSGKTVLLSEIAGSVQRQGGKVMFHDPEARLNPTFARIFGLELEKEEYSQPDTVPEVFKAVRAWNPDYTAKPIVHGIMADSLAALSTGQEMEKEEGDKMGMRRAKEFSEELRKTCRILAQKNYLMVCSNQVRENVDAGPYGQKYKSPGGESISFYSSLRLRTSVTEKIKKEKTFRGKKISRVIGVEIEVEVFKNSIWKPFHKTPISIIFDYGIDDIRQNIQFLKTYSGRTTYTLNEESLGQSLEDAITKIESEGREEELRQEVILLWNRIESQFNSKRKPKR